MSEVTIIIVGGNIAYYTRVMTTTIALETSKGNLELALALGTILILISISLNFIVFMVKHFTKIFHMIDDLYVFFDNQNSNPVEITANNISFRYGKKVIIDRLSFKTTENKIFLMGPNGAGKTLCLKILSGILKPDKGKVIFNKRVRIGYVPQKVIFLRRSIYENLAFTMKVFKFQKKMK